MSEKKKQLKLSSLFKIFSKRKIYDTSYVFEKVVEWCRSKLQFVGENDNRDVIFSTELKNAMGDNPYSNYVLILCFIPTDTVSLFRTNVKQRNQKISLLMKQV